MLLKDLSFSTPLENVAFDEVLFQIADKSVLNQNIEYLRFWESSKHFIVLGRIGKEAEDVDLGLAQADGIPILRRSSGGGTVVQGPGCLNYTCVLSKTHHPSINDLKASYAWISAQVIAALETLGVKAVFRPTSDIALKGNEMKFSGNAQRRGKTHILHHGTILYNFDLELISRYLKMPKDVPQYRKSRIHKDFVANIPIQPKAFKSALSAAFRITDLPQPLTPQEALFLNNYLK